MKAAKPSHRPVLCSWVAFAGAILSGGLIGKPYSAIVGPSDVSMRMGDPEAQTAGHSKEKPAG